MKINQKETINEEEESNFDFLAKKSSKEVEGYEEGLKHGKKIFFPLLLIVALISDITDSIPILGFLIKIFALLIIWYNFGIVGKAPSYLEEKHKIEISWKIRMILRLLGFVDIIPIINLLPLTTVSVLFVWFKNTKDINKKTSELKNEDEKRKNLFRQKNKEQDE